MSCYAVRLICPQISFRMCQCPLSLVRLRYDGMCGLPKTGRTTKDTIVASQLPRDSSFHFDDAEDLLCHTRMYSFKVQDSNQCPREAFLLIPWTYGSNFHLTSIKKTNKRTTTTTSSSTQLALACCRNDISEMGLQK